MKQTPYYIYSLNTGRVGSGSLYKTLNENNDNVSVYHERLTVHDHGIVTPDVGILRRYNELGLTDEVKSFWDKRQAIIEQEMIDKGHIGYIEIAHMLSKAGLIDWLSLKENKELLKNVAFINPRRRPEAIARSFIERESFKRPESRWLWGVSPEYKSNLLDTSKFPDAGYLGLVCWYVLEMTQRISKWEETLADIGVPFISIDVESDTKMDELSAFIEKNDIPIQLSRQGGYAHENKNPPSRDRMRIEKMCKEYLDHCSDLDLLKK